VEPKQALNWKWPYRNIQDNRNPQQQRCNTRPVATGFGGAATSSARGRRWFSCGRLLHRALGPNRFPPTTLIVAKWLLSGVASSLGVPGAVAALVNRRQIDIVLIKVNLLLGCPEHRWYYCAHS